MTNKCTEDQLEQAILKLLEEEGYDHICAKVTDPRVNANDNAEHSARGSNNGRIDFTQVVLRDDFDKFLSANYPELTVAERGSILHDIESTPSSDLYEANKQILHKVMNGFDFRRDDPLQKDIHIELINFNALTKNIFSVVNQLEIIDNETRIPDAIIYVNGLPLVVMEFKSAIREDATLFDAYTQLTTRYVRDVPELMKYNAFCIISDGVNNKMGSLFAPYEYYYSWRKITGDEKVDIDGIDSLYTMISGLLAPAHLIEAVRNFVYFPDRSVSNEKIVPRYPQFYAARALYRNILAHLRMDPATNAQDDGGVRDGKGGTYFGATGSGKSYTMLFLTRLLMKSPELASPTIVLITDRNDLDSQLSKQFLRAKQFIGDDEIISVENRGQLKELLQKRNSGGVFLTTIQKFTDDTSLLTNRANVICISDEAHRSQLNLDKKTKVTDTKITVTYGFAKHLHESLPNATYVGFTGTPIDETIDVFGEVINSYTMTESVADEITVPIVYEGRSAKVTLNNSVLNEIEDYYRQVEIDGANEYQIEQSKKEMLRMEHILGDPDRVQTLAEDFVNHYETRVMEGATVCGKAMFVTSSRKIGYAFYQELLKLRPDWGIARRNAPEVLVDEYELEKLSELPMVNMVMTRDKNDVAELYELLGTKEYRSELDRQFKNEKSNFKIAIVRDMWLTGFDVPELDTIYIDKPIQKHSLIQTVSRVNRRFGKKEEGLVVDYIGIKKKLDEALAQFSNDSNGAVRDIGAALNALRDNLEILKSMLDKFDSSPYFDGEPIDRLNCLNNAAEFIQITKDNEFRFMQLSKRMRMAYDLCCSSSKLTELERDWVHLIIAIRSIIFKLTRSNAPDAAQMNRKVHEMIEQALESNGIENFVSASGEETQDLFDENYLELLKQIKQPNTKLKALLKLLEKQIKQFANLNRAKGIEFAERFKKLVDDYNDRSADMVFVSEVYDDFTNQILDMIQNLKIEQNSFEDLGVSIDEKAFYDILKLLCSKYHFEYAEEKLFTLASEVKQLVDSNTKYDQWQKRDDIKAALYFDLLILLDEHKYPPVERDEVYKEIFEQALNYKKGSK